MFSFLDRLAFDDIISTPLRPGKIIKVEESEKNILKDSSNIYDKIHDAYDKVFDRYMRTFLEKNGLKKKATYEELKIFLTENSYEVKYLFEDFSAPNVQNFSTSESFTISHKFPKLELWQKKKIDSTHPEDKNSFSPTSC